MNRWRKLLAVSFFWVTWPGLWLVMRWSHRTRLLIICKDEFLVVQGWLSIGEWGLPGGGLHKGEPVAEGLIREVAEEIHLLFKESELTRAFDGLCKDRGISYKYHAFYIQVPQKPLIKLRNTELSAFSWQPIDNPRLPLNPDAKALVAWWLKQR